MLLKMLGRVLKEHRRGLSPAKVCPLRQRKQKKKKKKNRIYNKLQLQKHDYERKYVCEALNIIKFWSLQN